MAEYLPSLHQAGKILRIPVIKFLLHSASYLWFLITLLGESITMELYRDTFASRQQNILHSSFHMVWVVGRSALPPPYIHGKGSNLALLLTLCLMQDFSGMNVRKCGSRGCGVTSWTGGTAWT